MEKNNMLSFFRGEAVSTVVFCTFVFCASIFYSHPVISSSDFSFSNSKTNNSHIISIDKSENYNSNTPVISISESINEREIKGEDVVYYNDTLGNLEIQDVISSSLEWVTGEGGNVSFGFSNTPYWFRLRIKNISNKPQKRLLEIGNPILDYVSIYTVKNQKILNSQVAGDNLPFNTREIKHRNILYTLNIEPNDYVDMYVGVRSEGSIQAPMTLWEENSFYVQDQAKQLIQGLFYGALVLMLVYNLFLFISLRERSYFIYVLFVMSALMSQAAVRGDTFQYFWPENIWLSNKSAGFFTIAMTVTGYAFMMEFLRLKKKAPLAYKFLLGIEVYFVIMLISVPFAPYSIVMPLASYASILVHVVALFIAIKLSLKHDRTAQYFTLAWMSFSIGFLIFVLSKVGALPSSFLSEYGIQIGLTLNVFLLSFALADRINRANRNLIKAQSASKISDKIAREAQLEAMRIQIQANETLESNVKARTIELQGALNELSELNHKLEDLSSTDALTGLKNRGFFETQYDDEWKRASREKIPLALLMVDIDFFKKVNDKYGHLAGDMCIKEVATTIMQAAKRPIDTIARYGGEEFVIILPGTDVEGARVVAENIRKNIEMLKLSYESSPILLTASVGTASMVPQDDNDRALIAYADSALYKAKLSGRNRVVISKKDKKDKIFRKLEKD